jgi:hypothetical protein
LNPAVSPIRRSENCAIQKANDRSIIFIGKVNSIQIIGCSACLLNPAVSPIRRSENNSLFANDRSGIRAVEMYTVKINSAECID